MANKDHTTETPDASYIKNIDVTHETSDVYIGGIAKFVVGLLVLIAGHGREQAGAVAECNENGLPADAGGGGDLGLADIEPPLLCDQRPCGVEDGGAGRL